MQSIFKILSIVNHTAMTKIFSGDFIDNQRSLTLKFCVQSFGLLKNFVKKCKLLLFNVSICNLTVDSGCVMLSNLVSETSKLQQLHSQTFW